jgi:hypothetical protein
MGKKKDDSEASGSGTKKAERTNRVPLPVEVARLMHQSWTPCSMTRRRRSWRMHRVSLNF